MVDSNCKKITKAFSYLVIPASLYLESLNIDKTVIGKSIVNKIKKKQTLLQHQVKEGLILATRQSVDQLLQQCEDAINLAQDQYKNAATQIGRAHV